MAYGSVKIDSIVGTSKTLTVANVIQSGDSGVITSAMIADGAIVNADINASAAIVYSKLSLSSGITNTDISASAGIAASKISGTAAVLNTAQTFTAAQRGSVITLVDGATVTPDFSLGNNFVITISGNRTLANPTNVESGQTGTIVIKQDSSGSRTMSYGSAFKFPGGTAPTLSTTSGQTDVLAYFCESSSRINAALIKNLS